MQSTGQWLSHLSWVPKGLLRLFCIAAIVTLSACGGGGSGGTVAEEEPTNGGLVGEPLDPGQEPDPEPGPPPEPEPGPDPSPTAPDLNDFSPGFPPTGSQPTSLNDTPVVSLTVAYPTSGIPTGRRVVVSAYQEDPGSMAPGKLAWRRLFFTRGETSQRIVEFPDVPLTPNGSDGSITLLIDAVVFNDGWGAGPRVEYAAVPPTRVEFVPQVQDGRTVYEGIEFEMQLEAATLASTAGAARYVDTLSPENADSAMVVEHSSFYDNALYLLVKYSEACAEDDLEVQFQVSNADLAAKVIPTGVRRAFVERCGGEAKRLLIIPLEEISDRYADVHNTVFEPIELQGIGSFRPALRTFETERKFGTQPFCESDPGCVALVVMTPDGQVEVRTYAALTSGTRYSLSADGTRVYFAPTGGLFPPNSFATLSDNGETATASYLGFSFVEQSDDYTFLAVEGTIDAPALDPARTYHAAVVLFSPDAGGGDGIDILGRALITDFAADNASFRIEYRTEGIPPADPVDLQVSAIVLEDSGQPDQPAALAFRSAHPGNALSFFDSSSRASLFESQVQTQLSVTAFSGASDSIAADVIDQASSTSSNFVADLQHAAIYGNFLHLLFGGDSACQVAGGQFQLDFQPQSNPPSAGLSSRWLNGDGAPCVSPTQAHVSVDLSPVLAAAASVNVPAPESVSLMQYGDYTPTLTAFPTRRVYADTAGCFVQNTCDVYLDLRADGTMEFNRFGLIGPATYGVSLDGRTTFAQGVPLPLDDTRAYLSEDGQSLSSNFLGTLVLQQL